MKSDLQTYKESKAKKRITLVILIFVLLFLIFISGFLGRYKISFSDFFAVLLSPLMENRFTGSTEAVAFFNIRLPRILLAVFVGIALSVSGSVFQKVFQNPMASPDLLGASQGAGFGAALGLLLGLPSALVMVFSFVFGMATILLVYLIGNRTRGNRIIGILLSGIMIGSLFSSGTSALKLLADTDNQLPAITYWLMGSLSGTKKETVLFFLIPMIIGLVPVFLLRWKMNFLSLREEEALSLGVNVKRLRFVLILCATLLTAASVSVSGMIGWVGLLLPHLARKLSSEDSRYFLPTSAFLGGSFLLLVDDIARNLLSTEIPIGILTSLIGAPFFIYLLLRKEGKR